MRTFEDREDVEEWLEPLDYDAFWKAIDPFGLDIESRQSCDTQIAAGPVSRETVLTVLKAMVRLEIIERLKLKPRDMMPWHSLH